MVGGRERGGGVADRGLVHICVPINYRHAFFSRCRVVYFILNLCLITYLTYPTPLPPSRSDIAALVDWAGNIKILTYLLSSHKTNKQTNKNTTTNNKQNKNKTNKQKQTKQNNYGEREINIFVKNNNQLWRKRN